MRTPADLGAHTQQFERLTYKRNMFLGIFLI